MLLHAYSLGFSAWQTAIMFSLYELAGVVTNLAAGFMGAAWGIKWTLLTGEVDTTKRCRFLEPSVVRFSHKTDTVFCLNRVCSEVHSGRADILFCV